MLTRRRRRIAHGLLAALLVIALGLSGCTRSATPTHQTVASTSSPQQLVNQQLSLAVQVQPATIAKLVTPTSAVSAPGGSTVVAQLSTSIRPGGGPTEMLVLDRRSVGDREWLRVRLSTRPNDASGWIDAAVARLTTSPWRIVVSTEHRTIVVYHLEQKVRTFSVVVGAPATPTPRGLFAVAEDIRLSNPSGFYGPWMLTLTAHSNVLDTFAGGDGRVAIHGRGGLSLLDPLGSARSHGCVRLDNAAITWLAGVAQPGTPVEID